MVTWDAQDYKKHSQAQQQWALELIGKLGLHGTEAVLDLGCGDGKVTVELGAQLPKGSVLGVDSSQEMIRLAAEQFPVASFPNVSFVCQDARALDYHGRFDVVFSNAALHWVVDHQPVLQGIHRALKPKGRILLQMGGKGNAAEIMRVLDGMLVREAWKPFFEGFVFPYGFYDDQTYAQWLERAGLIPRRIELIPKRMIQESVDHLKGWVRTTWLPYTQRVPEHLRETFVQEVVDRYARVHPPDQDGKVAVSMVRLEVDATKE